MNKKQIRMVKAIKHGITKFLDSPVADYSPLQGCILMCTATQPGVTPSECGERFGIAPWQVSRAVSRLLEDDLVVATQDNKDRRVRRLTLSAYGDALLAEVADAAHEALSRK